MRMCRDIKAAHADGEMSREYLDGIALFNRREFHAAHDAWERRWLQLAKQGQPKDSGERLFLQALIQAAVAFYHLEHGRTKSAREMYRRAVNKFQRLDARVFMRLDVQEFLAQLDCSLAWLNDEQDSLDQSPNACNETARTLREAPTLGLIS